MFKLLILDFDGTIIDSNFIKQNAINDFAKLEYKACLKDFIKYENTKNHTRYEQLSIVKGSPLTVYEKTKLDEFINNKILKATIDFNLFLLIRICKIKKIKVFVVSNTPHSSLLFLINKLKLGSLIDGSFGKKNNVSKKDLFLFILKLCDIKPQEALSVGDDISDFLYSKECNIPFIGINNSSLNFISSNNKVCKDLRSLISIINYQKKIE